ncbi:hypothetical protein [Granulibacter bethesdensis]|uniref:hypothetical protein n=1 Tax=Granulibacter bethesdensis TaxID=364410 RepID=UPI0003F1DAC4|nr:hypothetical protein [Granulibacter bethesdensis]AHJ66383.1 hypothetical protein GbCGDNIH4_7156 [Granulibacter bethesdensis CGDNIH4]
MENFVGVVTGWVRRQTPHVASLLVSGVLLGGGWALSVWGDHQRDTALSQRDAADLQTRVAAIEEGRRQDDAAARLHSLEEHVTELRASVERADHERADLRDRYYVLDRFLAVLATKVDRSLDALQRTPQRGR